ncbi:MAG: MlaD family protein [Acidobacteriota bacterium]
MSLGGNKGLWLAAAAVILIGFFLWLLFGTQPFLLVVLYDDVGELKRGDPVVWRDFAVGKVDKIEPLVDNQVGVTIRLREDYRGQITRGTDFALKRTSLMGLVGQNAIEVIPPESPGELFAGGEKVQGKIPVAPSLVDEGIRMTAQFWRDLKDHANRLLEEFQSSEFKQEAAEAMKDLRVLAERGAEQAMGGLERFRREHRDEIDRVIRKLEELRDKMRRAGDEEGARQVERQLDGLKTESPK